MANDETAISLQQVGKKYQLGKVSSDSLRETLTGFFSRKKQTKDEFHALKNISFDVGKGEIVGIIGKNGAGKSTLLKILSKITKPSEGRIEINGRLASLLEVGTGFHPELTGRENIFLNGTILGMTRQEIKSKFDEIVAFSGVEKFLDTPVKHYSSGMYVRLAFSVAAHLETEILVIDEVLAVGDSEFQKKCLGKMSEVAEQGRTVLFVSHDMGAMSRLCKKGIFLENGSVSLIGSMDQVIRAYLSKRDHTSEIANAENRKGNQQVKFTNFVVRNKEHAATANFFIGDALVLDLELTRMQSDIDISRVAVQIIDSSGRPVSFSMPEDSGIEKLVLQDVTAYRVTFKDIRLYPDDYYFNLISACKNSAELYDEVEFGSFTIESGGDLTSRPLNKNQGQYFLTPSWERL